MRHLLFTDKPWLYGTRLRRRDRMRLVEWKERAPKLPDGVRVLLLCGLHFSGEVWDRGAFNVTRNRAACDCPRCLVALDVLLARDLVRVEKNARRRRPELSLSVPITDSVRNLIAAVGPATWGTM